MLCFLSVQKGFCLYLRGFVAVGRIRRARGCNISDTAREGQGQTADLKLKRFRAAKRL